MELSKIRKLIALAAENLIEINELTVSASQYEQLIHDAPVTCKYYDASCTEYALRIYNILIKKRACKGCCSHD